MEYVIGQQVICNGTIDTIKGFLTNDPDGYEVELVYEGTQTFACISPVVIECPVCNRDNTRPDYDFPDTMRCCDDCGADYMSADGEIILDPRKI